jgi:hypothetical protein
MQEKSLFFLDWSGGPVSGKYPDSDQGTIFENRVQLCGESALWVMPSLVYILSFSLVLATGYRLIPLYVCWATMVTTVLIEYACWTYV